MKLLIEEIWGFAPLKPFNQDTLKSFLRKQNPENDIVKLDKEVNDYFEAKETQNFECYSFIPDEGTYFVTVCFSRDYLIDFQISYW
ncbi:MAG: hypothetical protein R3C61_08305 [Bacteroidia bacterium]